MSRSPESQHDTVSMSIGGLIEEGTKDLGLRFNLLNVVPGVALFSYGLALWWSGAPEQPPNFEEIAAHFEELEKGEGLLLAVGVLVFALAFQPLQFPLLRLLEGYWPRWLAPLSAAAVSRQRKRRDALKQQTATTEGNPSAALIGRMAAADWRLRREYPSDARLLPTALGNALRASEDVPSSRYGLDGVVIWPRLYPLLPDIMRKLLDDRRTQLDVAARLCVTAVLALVLTVVFFRGQWVPFTGFGVLTLLLAWLCYRGAVAAAIAYGEAIQVAYDLYRFKLHTALHLPAQPNLDSERALNTAISDFLRQNIDDALRTVPFCHRKTESDEKTKDEEKEE